METVQQESDNLLSLSLLSMTKDEPLEEHARRYLRFLSSGNNVCIALEAIDPTSLQYRYTPLLLALATTQKDVERLAYESDESLLPKGCFVQQNALSQAVLAKQAGDKWVPIKPGQGLKTSHVIARRAFYFDFDAVRDDGVSSTREEFHLALARADQAVVMLSEILGGDTPLGYASSGNGAHVHVALDFLPNDEVTEGLIRDCLQAADKLFTDSRVKVDTGVFDARRIAPLYGTMKRKGADYRPDALPKEQWRPHRRTGFICRDQVRRLSIDDLQSLCAELLRRAGQCPVQSLPTPQSSPAPNAAKSPWDQAKEVDIEQVSSWLGLGQGSSMVCPGCKSTQGYGRIPGSNLTKCHHNSCTSKGNPNKPGLRTTIDLVVENMSVSPKEAVALLAKQFGFAAPQKAATGGFSATPPAATGASWEKGLLRDKFGQIMSKSANVELIMVNDPAWSGVLRFNAFDNTVVFGAPPPSGFLPRKAGDEWTDVDDVAAINWLQRNWGVFIGETTIHGIVALVAQNDTFDPLRDSLKSLVWDGVPRVDTWLNHYLGAQDSPYVRMVGRWWLISAVARVFKPGCSVHHTIILEGAQGAGKSTVVQVLAGKDFYLEDMTEVGSIESAKQLQGVWIVELSELDAMRHAEQTTVKRFISQSCDRFRPSYGRRSQLFPRRTVFIGTTNHDDYLRDSTGGRRFWPVKCGKIDTSAVAADRDQLWAETVALFEQGCAWWPKTDEERALCGTEQATRYDEDIWTEKVAAFVRDKEHVKNYDILESLGVEANRMSGQNSKRIGSILRRLGWQEERTRQNGTRLRRWVRGPTAEATPFPKPKPSPDRDAANVYPLRPVFYKEPSEAPSGEAQVENREVVFVDNGETQVATDDDASDGLDSEVRQTDYSGFFG